uniref:Ubiquitin-like domain-containing protein n=1 Tax=Globodera pallida TaxID=36090 RepID=A0A183BYQ7_GLOPA
MTDYGSDDESIKMIELKFKTIQETYNVKVKENSTIAKLKKTMSQKLNQPEEKICLIFSGKILKDHENLTQHHIGDGMVLHMVIRNQPLTSTTSGSSNPPAPAAPTGGTGADFTAGHSPLGAISAALLNNPELVQGVLNSPFMESMLANPDYIRAVLSENPQFQQIIQVI